MVVLVIITRIHSHEHSDDLGVGRLIPQLVLQLVFDLLEPLGFAPG